MGPTRCYCCVVLQLQCVAMSAEQILLLFFAAVCSESIQERSVAEHRSRLQKLSGAKGKADSVLLYSAVSVAWLVMLFQRSYHRFCGNPCTPANIMWLRLLFVFLQDACGSEGLGPLQQPAAAAPATAAGDGLQVQAPELSSAGSCGGVSSWESLQWCECQSWEQRSGLRAVCWMVVAECQLICQ
jgi:hypothetical protein